MDIRMMYGATEHFAGRTTNSTSALGDPLLRADWPAPRRPAKWQRGYDPTVLYRLAIIQRAHKLGFTLSEIRRLFFGFRNISHASERVRTLAELDQCGKAIFLSMNRDIVAMLGRSLQQKT